MTRDTTPSIDSAVLTYRRYWTELLAANEPMWSGLELTILQLKGLILLEVRGEMTIGGIAGALGLGRSSASALVEQLVQMGVAVRVEDGRDRRRSLVALTDEGRELSARLHQGDEHFMGGLFSRLAPDDLAALEQGLCALADVLRTVNAQTRGAQSHEHGAAEP